MCRDSRQSVKSAGRARAVGHGRRSRESSSRSVVGEIHSHVRNSVAVLIFHRDLQRFRNCVPCVPDCLFPPLMIMADGRRCQRSLVESRRSRTARRGRDRKLVFAAVGRVKFVLACPLVPVITGLGWKMPFRVRIGKCDLRIDDDVAIGILDFGDQGRRQCGADRARLREAGDRNDRCRRPGQRCFGKCRGGIAAARLR